MSPPRRATELGAAQELEQLIVTGSNAVAAALERAHTDQQDAAYDHLFEALRALGTAKRAVRHPKPAAGASCERDRTHLSRSEALGRQAATPRTRR